MLEIQLFVIFAQKPEVVVPASLPSAYPEYAQPKDSQNYHSLHAN